MRSADTTAEAHAAQLEAHRALAPVERLESALGMSDELMAVTIAGIRSRRPELSDDDVIAELHRVLGHPDLLR